MLRETLLSGVQPHGPGELVRDTSAVVVSFETTEVGNMSADDVVLYETADGIATITLNRPDRLNAWTGPMGRAYFDALDRAADDPEVRVIVITGAGRGFCAGADMDMLQGIGEAGGTGNQPETRPHTYATSIPKPVIAAINGACAGLGFVHAMMADIRFAAEGAKFTTAFSRRGLVAEHGVSWVLPRVVGPAVALDLLMSGRVFLADEAATIGVVSRTVPADELMSTVMDYARDVADNVASTSTAVIKHQVWKHLEQSLADSLNETNTLMANSLRRADFKEGVASFVDKRSPNFVSVTRSDATEL